MSSDTLEQTIKEDICPRRHTCASLKCPDDWENCGIPMVLKSVAEWLYPDDSSDGTKIEEE